MAAVAGTMVGKVPQHLTALAAANDIRRRRAALKRAIKRGEVGVAEVLADTPDEALSMPVMELLMAPTRWGRERARRALKRAGAANGERQEAIPELKPVGELTPRQRTALSRLV